MRAGSSPGRSSWDNWRTPDPWRQAPAHAAADARARAPDRPPGASVGAGGAADAADAAAGHQSPVPGDRRPPDRRAGAAAAHGETLLLPLDAGIGASIHPAPGGPARQAAPATAPPRGAIPHPAAKTARPWPPTPPPGPRPNPSSRAGANPRRSVAPRLAPAAPRCW